jgi:excisionase family DNA binding protein
MTSPDSVRQPVHGIERLLSVEEVSEVLHISERGIYRLVSNGEIPRVKVGQRTLFDPADIRRFIDGRRSEQGAEGQRAEVQRG